MDTNSKTVELAKLEMIEAQKERDSLMRWKLILVSVIGAAALGFSQESPLENAEFALCLIPFTCVYADILCRNLSIRTKMISKFLSQKRNDDLEIFYQQYKDHRRNSLETFALRISTIFSSVLIIPIGIIVHYAGISTPGNSRFYWQSSLFLLSGVLGILLSLVVERRYQEQKKALDAMQVFSDTSEGG